MCVPSQLLFHAYAQTNYRKETSGIYNFSNIRYAAPPLGDLRFSAPVPPEWDRSKVQDGSVGRICPQATPLWLTEIEPDFVESQLSGRTFNGSANISDYTYDPPPQDPRTTEDCLFLDVLVPKKIFDKGHDRLREKAPVLVWIYGGGYTAGEKSAFNASGLMQRSMQDGRDGIVYVSLNYRVSNRYVFPANKLTFAAVRRIRLAGW